MPLPESDNVFAVDVTHPSVLDPDAQRQKMYMVVHTYDILALSSRENMSGAIEIAGDPINDMDIIIHSRFHRLTRLFLKRQVRYI